MSPRINISLSDLEAFVAVVEHENFSRAAAALGLSQPTVSQRLQTLETQCGLKLLDRRQNVKLTANGQEIYNRARALLADANKIETVAKDLGAMARGRLKIGFTVPPHAMHALAHLRTTYPGVEFSVKQGNTAYLLSAISDCQIDAGLMTLIDVPEGIRAERLAEQRLHLVFSSHSPLAKRRTVGLTSLKNRTIILREQGSLTRKLFEMACEQAELSFDDIIVVPGREAVKEAAAAGLGVGIVLTGEIGNDSRISSTIVHKCKLTAGIYAVSLRETAGLPLIEAFMEACRATTPGRRKQRVAA